MGEFRRVTHRLQPTKEETVKYIDCGKSGDQHSTPDCSFDWAFPIDWIMNVQQVLGADYQPLGGHVVWRYGPEDGIFGRPVGLCERAQDLIDLYHERMKEIAGH